MDTGRTILRLTMGPLFIGHGTQKLAGWFGGAGPEGTAAFFEGLGLRPGRRHAIAAGAAETAGGAMITLGLLTPAAAATLRGVMTTAIRKVHAKNGVWSTNGGFEYNAVMIGALAAIVEQGPGRPSVDTALLPRLKGPGLALLSLGAGVAGSYISEQLFNEPAAADQQAAAPASAGQTTEEGAGGEKAAPSGNGRASEEHAGAR